MAKSEHICRLMGTPEDQAHKSLVVKIGISCPLLHNLYIDRFFCFVDIHRHGSLAQTQPDFLPVLFFHICLHSVLQC